MHARVTLATLALFTTAAFAQPDSCADPIVDIGNSVAEELNSALLSDLLDTSSIENFGWGRNDRGQLGIGRRDPIVKLPSRIRSLAEKKILMTAAG